MLFHFKNLLKLPSLHGLVRGDNMELGRDSDTGGQVRASSHLSLFVRVLKGFLMIAAHCRFLCYSILSISVRIDFLLKEHMQFYCSTLSFLG